MLSSSKSHQRLVAKRVTRLNAVQAVFQMETTQQGLDSILYEFLECGFGQKIGNTQLQKPLKSLFKELLNSALNNQDTIDESIKKCLADNWEFSRIDPTLRAIFRIALAEHLLQRTPIGVIKNEYVEITHGFYPDSDQVGFVNAILAKIIQEKPPEESTK